MYIPLPALLSAIFIIALLCLVLGIYAGSENPGQWKYRTDESPPDRGRAIKNYPVAFFDSEFGIVVDQAEYHPNRADKWLTVPAGDTCNPYAWYDLPYPPHPRIPQDMPSRRAIDTYI